MRACSVWAVDCYTEIDPYYWQFDVPSMIHVREPVDIASIRSDLITYIWRDAGWPGDKMPELATTVWEENGLGYECEDALIPSAIPNLVLWLDAGDSSTFTFDNGRVAEWRDRSDYANHASQNDPALQPTYDAEGMNGHPAISFDGGDDFLSVPDGSSIDATHLTAFMVLMVLDLDNVTMPIPMVKMPIYGSYLFFLQHETAWPHLLTKTDGYYRVAHDIEPVGAGAEIWSGRQDGRTLRFLHNGMEVGTDAAPGTIATTDGPLILGGGAGNALSGSIAEILLYDRALTNFEMERVGAYLACRYGIARPMPRSLRSLNSSSLARVERLDVAMDYGLYSYAYLLHPRAESNRLLIFHQGHSDDLFFGGGGTVIRRFLDQGFSFLTFWMPLFGENPDVAYDVPGYGTVTLRDHGEMSEYLENERGSFERFFLEPVIVGINSALARHSYLDVNMMGISGGGWATHLIAAIDPRIRLSFPVAGSLPLYLRSGPCPNGSQGDAEQTWAPLYEQTATWLDLYVLGGTGTAREQVQVLNQFDSCCFWGVNYQTYEPNASAAVDTLGPGAYSVFLDGSHHEHKISDLVIEQVLGPRLNDLSKVEEPGAGSRGLAPRPYCFPSPFTHATRIFYEVPGSSVRAYSSHDGTDRVDISLDVYGISGRRIRSLVAGARQPGHYVDRWDGRDDEGHPVPAGVYVVRVRAGATLAAGRIVLIR